MPVTWSDEKLILLYCPGRGSNSRPSARRSFKHDQCVLRPNHSATAAVWSTGTVRNLRMHNLNWTLLLERAFFNDQLPVLQS